MDGELVAVWFAIECSPTRGDLTVEVQGVSAGAPDDAPIASFTVPGVRFPAFLNDPMGFALRRIDLPEPVTVHQGVSIALVLSSVGELGAGCQMAVAPTGDLYGGGDAYFTTNDSPPGWHPWSNGTGRFDLPFRTTLVPQ